jgi:hypothetical protein
MLQLRWISVTHVYGRGRIGPMPAPTKLVTVDKGSSCERRRYLPGMTGRAST